MKEHRLAIIIPAYNEGTVIKKVIESIPKKIDGISDLFVIVVDDGSKDDTGVQASKVKGTIVLTQKINLGVGGATFTGLRAARKLKATIAVTIDGDGQHDSADIIGVIAPLLQKKANIVLGNRFGQMQEVPLQRVILNWLGSLYTYFLYGVKLHDTQTGFRAYDRQALDLLKITSNGYEACSELIGEAKSHKLKICEVPIKVYYTKYSMGKGQNILRSLDMVINLFFNSIRKIK